jgi:hypothetical protein
MGRVVRVHVPASAGGRGDGDDMRRSRWFSAAAAAAVLLSGCSGSGGGGSAPTPSPGGSTEPTAPASPAIASATPGPATTPAGETPASAATDAPAPTVAPTDACVTEFENTPANATAEPVPLTDVRVGVHGGVARVVFEFAGDDVPAFDVAPAEPPFVQDASGLPVDVPGAAFLRIHFPYATGMSTYHGPTTFAGPGAGSTTLASLVRTGDFEAVMTWVAGTAGRACVRVTVLDAPTRVVLDVSPSQ